MNKNLIILLASGISIIALLVAVFLSINFPEPSIQMGEVIDKCISAFSFSSLALIGLATGINPVKKDGGNSN